MHTLCFHKIHIGDLAQCLLVHKVAHSFPAAPVRQVRTPHCPGEVVAWRAEPAWNASDQPLQKPPLAGGLQLDFEVFGLCRRVHRAPPARRLELVETLRQRTGPVGHLQRSLRLQLPPGAAAVGHSHVLAALRATQHGGHVCQHHHFERHCDWSAVDFCTHLMHRLLSFRRIKASAVSRA